jgi:hypothetical protein
MKNEVKKKMHEVRRALLYQSHSATWAKKKISTSLHPGTSQACSHKRKMKHIDSPRASPSFGRAGANDSVSASSNFIVFDPFRRWRIYNESCEIFMGA